MGIPSKEMVILSVSSSDSVERPVYVPKKGNSMEKKERKNPSKNLPEPQTIPTMGNVLIRSIMYTALSS